jgi:predicted dehydrogenase
MIRLAVVGLGRWGQNIVKTLAHMPQCDLAVVQDPSPQARKEVTSLAPNVATLDEVLAVPVDGVIVATPSSTHFEVARPFIERHSPVFIEKPLTTQLDDALAIWQAAHSSATLVFVGHIHLYNPAYRKMKELAGQGGEIRLLSAESMNNGPYRNDVSALWDWAPHDVAAALDLFGELPESVNAWGVEALRPGKFIDAAWVQLSFSGGRRAIIAVNWWSPVKRKRITVSGVKHTIVFDDTSSRKVMWYEDFGPQVNGDAVMRHEPHTSLPPYDDTPPLQEELGAFIEAIESKQQREEQLLQAIHVIRILTAADLSMKRAGALVPLAEVASVSAPS